MSEHDWTETDRSDHAERFTKESTQREYDPAQELLRGDSSSVGGKDLDAICDHHREMDGEARQTENFEWEINDGQAETRFDNPDARVLEPGDARLEAADKSGPFLDNGYTHEHAHEFPPLTPGGEKVQWHENGCAWQSHEGAAVNLTKLEPASERQGFERSLPAPGEADMEGMQRAHATGSGLGPESPYGMSYAHEDVNQILQNHGVEAELRSMRDQVGDDVDLYLVTEAYYRDSSPHNLEGASLREINYEVYAVEGTDGKSLAELQSEGRDVLQEGERVYSASIEVSGDKDQPSYRLEQQHGESLENYLKSTEDREEDKKK
jgi:hypothetical protein